MSFASANPKVIPAVAALPEKIYPFWRISNIQIGQGDPLANPSASIEFKRYRVLEDGRWEDDNTASPNYLTLPDVYASAATDTAAVGATVASIGTAQIPTDLGVIIQAVWSKALAMAVAAGVIA